MASDPSLTAHRTWAGRWVPRLYLAVATLLIPWDVYLASSLPLHSVAYHYRGAWVGFDLFLILVLARTGWLAAKRDPHVVLTATACATMLIIDAWFDVLTAHPGADRTTAILMALILELPGAFLCGLLARRGLAAMVARIVVPPRV